MTGIVISILLQGSYFFRLIKFNDFSMIFPGFFSKFPFIFSLFLKWFLSCFNYKSYFQSNDSHNTSEYFQVNLIFLLRFLLKSFVINKLMAYSHCTEPGPVQGMGLV